MGPSIPSTVAIMMSKFLSSAEIDEKSDIRKGNKLNTVLVAEVLKLVCRLDGLDPLRVINVYLLYEVFESIVTAVAVSETADYVNVTLGAFSFIFGFSIINIPQLLGITKSVDATLVTYE